MDSSDLTPIPARVSKAVLTVDIVDFSLMKPLAMQIRAIKTLIRMLHDAIPAKKDNANHRFWSPAGDGGCMTFEDIEISLATAVSLGKLLRDHNEGLPHSNQLHLRMGLHIGPVTKEVDFDDRENVWGDGINMSTRVAGLARPGQILASEEFYNMAELATRKQVGGDSIEVCGIGKWWAKHNKSLNLYNIWVSYKDKDGVGIPTSEIEEWYGPFSFPLDLAIRMYAAMAVEQREEGPAFRAAVLAKRLLDLKAPHEQQKLATDIIESISEERHPRKAGKTVLYDVFFSKLSPAALLHFFKNAEFMDFNKEDIIFEEGKKANSMMMIVSGESTLTVKGQSIMVRDRYSRKEKPLVMREGEIIGEMGLFNPGETRTATLKATRTTIVLSLDYRFLKTVSGASEQENRIRKEIRDQIWRFYQERTVENQISTHSLLQELKFDQRYELSKNSEFLPDRPDKPIQLDVDDLVNYWTIVVAGKVVVRVTKPDRSIGYNTGDFLGPIGLVLSDIGYSDVEVLANTHLVRFPVAVIEKLMHESDEFRDKCYVEAGKTRFRLGGPLRSGGT